MDELVIVRGKLNRCEAENGILKRKLSEASERLELLEHPMPTLDAITLQIAEAKKRLSVLESLAATLEKTKDGVPITNGMPLYFPHPEVNQVFAFKANTSPRDYIAPLLAPAVEKDVPAVAVVPARECYSSRSKAEAEMHREIRAGERRPNDFTKKMVSDVQKENDASKEK